MYHIGQSGWGAKMRTLMMEHENFQLNKNMTLVQQQEISDHAYTYSNFQPAHRQRLEHQSIRFLSCFLIHTSY